LLLVKGAVAKRVSALGDDQFDGGGLAAGNGHVQTP
jgi:hypothetical protein